MRISDGDRVERAMYGHSTATVDVTQQIIVSLETPGVGMVVGPYACGLDSRPHVGIHQNTLIIDIVDKTGTRRTERVIDDTYIFRDPTPTSPHEPLVSFVVKARHGDESNLRACVHSLEHVTTPYELIVVLYSIQDDGEMHQWLTTECESLVRCKLHVFEYNVQVSSPGIQTLVTDHRDTHSVSSFDRWCRERTTAPYIFDFATNYRMSGTLARELDDPSGTMLRSRVHDSRGFIIPSLLQSGYKQYENVMNAQTAITGYSVERGRGITMIRGTYSHEITTAFEYGDPVVDDTSSVEKPWYSDKSWHAIREDLVRRKWSNKNDYDDDLIAMDRAAIVDRGGITVCLTACDRPDLLRKTIESFVKYNTCPIVEFRMFEASGKPCIDDFVHDLVTDCPVTIKYAPCKTLQIDAIDWLYTGITTPYIFHMEEDWEFLQPSFIEQSVPALHNDTHDIYTVWLRPHNDTNWHPLSRTEPCTIPGTIFMHHDYQCQHYRFSGVTWNPGLRRTDIATKFSPHRHNGITTETALDGKYRVRGYRSVILATPHTGHVTHLGNHRHVN
jgi:hypothetical protein